MTEINPSRFNIAKEIVAKLDAKDGKEDGSISASIWNNFVDNNETGGKHIQNYISVKNAINSVAAYLSRTVKNTKETAQLGLEELQVLWGDMKKVDDKTDDKGLYLKDPNPPAKDENPPKLDDFKVPKGGYNLLSDAYAVLTAKTDEIANPDVKNMPDNEILKQKFEEYAEKTGVEIPKGSGRFFDFDSEGRIEKVKDKNGNTILNTSYKEDGSFDDYSEHQYDEKGHEVVWTGMDKDGISTYVYFSTYDGNGNMVQTVDVCTDGVSYDKYEYDKNGHEVGHVHRNANGEVGYYEKTEYDKNGSLGREICYKPDGTVESVIHFDKNGAVDENGRRIV